MIYDVDFSMILVKFYFKLKLNWFILYIAIYQFYVFITKTAVYKLILIVLALI